MILTSAFNWSLDLDLPRNGTIFQSEFIFNLLLMNICFISAYLNRDKNVTKYSPWILTLIFCLYAFWDPDYFHFAEIYYEGLKDFRDLLYQPLSLLSLRSYIVFRFFIWGIALLLYYKTAKRFNIKPNKAIFVFVLFFLLTFSYARVSLGMASYFYGLSFLLIKKQQNLLRRLILAACFFILAFLAHRSIAFLICLTPLCYIKVTKRTIILLIIGGMCFTYGLDFIINILLSNIGASDFSVANAANMYAGLVYEQEMNWKYKLVTNLHYIGFYIGILTIIYKFFFNKTQYNIPQYIYSLIPLIVVVQFIAISLINSSATGLWIIGYRFLFMTGIPLCIIIGYMYQHMMINKKWLKIIFFCPVLYSEGFIIGKILSLS